MHDNEYRQGSTDTTTQSVVFAAPPYFYPKSEEVSHDLKGIKHPDSSALGLGNDRSHLRHPPWRWYDSQHLGIPTSLPEIAASFRMAASIGIEIPACLIEFPSTETL